MPINSPSGFLDITNATLRTSNLEAQNLLITGGNIYVTSELEADATVLNLENVTRKGNVSSNTIEITNATTGIVATGNIHALKFIGSGAGLTSIPSSAISGTLSQWSDGTNSDVYIASNVGIGNVHTLTSNTLQVGGNLYVRDTDANVLTVNGNVVASYFEGDGSKLSGIVTDLQGVTDNGNVTTNVVQFSNVTTGLVTTANIEVGGDIKVVGLSAGKVPYVASDKFLKDSFITMTGDATVITSNLDVTGNIFMRGKKFIVESETKLINDAIIGIANNNTVSTTDKGIIMQNTTGNVAIIHHGTGDGFADQLTFGYTADPLDTATVTNDLTKELTVNVLGNVITQNNLSVGGTLSINTISAASSHSLQAVTNLGNVTSNTVQFSNAITSLVASSNIVATGNVSAGHDTDTTSYFGRAAVGYMGTTDHASFAHFERNSPAQYALKQTAAGPTYINTPAGAHIRFTVNDGNAGAEKMRITSAGKVGIGVSAPDATLHVEGNAYVSSNLTVSGNVLAGYLYGDGSNISGIPSTLQAITDSGPGANVTSNTVQFSNATTGFVTTANVEVGGELTVSGSITGRGRFVPKTRTITHGTSLSGEVDTYTLESDENRIVLNNAQGTAASSRTYTANFNSGVPTEVGTIIYLEINSSRTASAAGGVNHKSEIQFNGTKVLSTGDNYISPNGSYSKTLKRVIILTSNGWEDITEIKHGDNGNVDIPGNVGIGTTSPNATLDVNGSTRSGYDTDTTSYFGRSAVGYCGHANAMSIAHIDSNSNGGYALLQESNGQTMLNSASGQSVHIRQGNTDKLVINSSGYLKYNNQPRFSAYSNSGDANFSGFNSPVKLTSTLYNVGSHYSTSTGGFTAPVTGHYRFSIAPWNNSTSEKQFSMWYRTSNSGAWDDIAPYKLLGGSSNGDEIIWSNREYRGLGHPTFDLYVPANWQIAFGGRGGVSITIYRAHSYFSGELISVA